MKYDVRQTFFGLVMEELGVSPSPADRETLYAAFLSHFGLSSELQVYALLMTDPAKVRAWIRSTAE